MGIEITLIYWRNVNVGTRCTEGFQDCLKIQSAHSTTLHNLSLISLCLRRDHLLVRWKNYTLMPLLNSFGQLLRIQQRLNLNLFKIFTRILYILLELFCVTDRVGKSQSAGRPPRPLHIESSPRRATCGATAWSCGR